MSRHKQMHRQERKLRLALEDAGVGERVRAAHLALRREDVQIEIHEKMQAPSAPAEEMVAAALASRGYDLSGVQIRADFKPGLPRKTATGIEVGSPRLVLCADASPAAVATAVAAAGLPPRLATREFLN